MLTSLVLWSQFSSGIIMQDNLDILKIIIEASSCSPCGNVIHARAAKKPGIRINIISVKKKTSCGLGAE